MEGIIYKHYLDMINSEPYIELHKYYTQETFLDILNVARQENPHSSYLRWLFSADGSHGLGALPLQKLLQTVCLAKEKMYATVDTAVWWNNKNNLLNLENNSYLQAIKYGDYKMTDISVKTETVLSGQRRADVFISCKIKFTEDKQEKYLVTLIENKVKSSENQSDNASKKSQTEEYARIVFDEEDDKKSVFNILKNIYEDESDEMLKDALKLCIYLNPYKTREIKESIDKKINQNTENTNDNILARSNQFITMNYQYLLDGVIEPAFMTCQSPLEKSRLDEYIRCLGQSRISVVKDSSKKDENYLIMALSSREKKYAQELWDNPLNQTVIREIYNRIITERKVGFDAKELPFWFSLANVYSILFDDHEKNAQTEEERNTIMEFKNQLDSIKRSTKRYAFEYTSLISQKKDTYQSFKKKNIGLLCHDIISDVILYQNMTRPEVETLRYSLQNAFPSSWLREIILFDDEVTALKNPSTSNQNFKYNTPDIVDFAGSYFSYLHENMKRNKNFDPAIYDKQEKDALAVTLSDGTKVYIAKFWGSGDVEKLKSIFKLNYGLTIHCEMLQQ